MKSFFQFTYILLLGLEPIRRSFIFFRKFSKWNFIILCGDGLLLS